MSPETATVADTPDVAGTPVGHEGTNVSISEHRAWSGSTALAVAGLLGGTVLFLGSIALMIWAGISIGTGSLSPALGGTLIGVGAVVFLLSLVILAMLRIINPGHTHVVQFFGRYLGTNRTTGLTLVPPLATSRMVSVRVRNFETNEIKVNDLNGNPVMIGAIIVWQVSDTAKATFSVEDVEEFIHSQSESALRHVATAHPYDSAPGRFTTEATGDAPTSLAGSTDVVSRELADEVAARVAVAGLEIVEARISALSYARKSPVRCCSVSRPRPWWMPASRSWTARSPWSRPRSTSSRSATSWTSTRNVGRRWSPTCSLSCVPTPRPSR